MKKIKKIKRGELVGLNEISEEQFLANEKMANELMEVPIKNIVVPFGSEMYMTPNWCKNGDMERCPAPCGACLDNSNPRFLKVRKAITIQRLDVDAYNLQSKNLL